MSSETDDRLRTMLRTLRPPDEDAAQRAAVRDAVTRAAATRARLGSRGRANEAPEQGSVPLGRHTRARRLVLAAVTVAVAAATVGLVLLGAPDWRGPTAVSAGEALNHGLAALSGSRSYEADVIVRGIDSVYDEASGSYSNPGFLVRFHLVRKADGSYRVELTNDGRAGWWPNNGPLAQLVAYDAARGTRVVCSRRGVWTEHRNVALGPPDSWAGLITHYDFGAIARAMSGTAAARLETTTYEGRPAWVVTLTDATRASSPPREDYGTVYAITIDQRSHLPVRFQFLGEGFVHLEVLLRNQRVDEPLPADAFTPFPPPGIGLRRVDDGFVRVALPVEAARKGYAAVVPATLPPGFSDERVVVARHATTVNGVTAADRVYEVRYGRGFDWLVVSTRRVSDPYVMLDESFEPTVWWASLRQPVEITSGPFADADAFIALGPQVSTPYLQALKYGVLLTVSGSATADDLLAVADSLRDVRP